MHLLPFSYTSMAIFLQNSIYVNKNYKYKISYKFLFYNKKKYILDFKIFYRSKWVWNLSLFFFCQSFSILSIPHFVLHRLNKKCMSSFSQTSF